MDSGTPQGHESIDSELFPIYQLILDGRSEELAKMVKKNPYLIYQIVELITERILIAPDQPHERLVYCFYLLKELVQEYGIPFILLFNNMDAAMKLHEVALKGLKPQVTAFLVPCLETFSFDADKAIITYLADLYIQLNPLANSFPTKELPKNAFTEFFKKVQKVLEACQEPLSGTEAEKKQLQGEVQNLLKNEDFENKDFNALEKELAIYYLNELLGARDRLEPEAGRKASIEEEEKVSGEEILAKSPAQDKKVIEKEENKSPVIKKSKEEEGHLARFKTSFVLNEKVYEDEGKTTEYKNYRYPFEGLGDLDPSKVLQKTICAFLNRRGGRIYLGIHDNKSVRGLHLTQKQRDDLKLEIQALIRTFEPDIINSEAVSIVFIPVKQSANSNPVPGLFVVKIIVKQGDTSQLYSVQKRLLECYIRNDARVDLLSARETSDHIRKRDRNPEKPVAEEEFEDPKPELLVDEYEQQRFMSNMNDSKVRFDKALKHGPAAGGNNQKFPQNQYQKNQQGQGNLLQQFQQNFKAQQGGFVQKMQAQDHQQQQHGKPIIFGQQQQNKQQGGGAFGGHQNQNQHQQNQNQNQNQQVFGGGGKNNNFSHQNQNQNQQGFGGAKNPHNYHHQHQNSNQNFNQNQNQNQGFQGKNKVGKGGAPDWKEKWGIGPDQEIFEVAIDGLPLDMTQKEFEALVAQGNSFKIINPRKIKTKNGLTKGFANFTNIEEADKFISLFHEKKVGNSVISVEFNFAL